MLYLKNKIVMSYKISKKFKFISLVLIMCSHFSYANTDGITLESTRVIFDSSKSSAKVKLNNDTNKDWLLRAWLSDYGTSNKNNTFIITPPLYRIGSNESIQFKINKFKLAENLPRDRESVFHINIMAIPGVSKEGQAQNNAIQLALNNKIKLFYRPHEINNIAKVSKAFKELKTEINHNALNISNPTPYYITIKDANINGVKVTGINDFMIAPFSKLAIPGKNIKTFSYSTINDYGGETPKRNITF